VKALRAETRWIIGRSGGSLDDLASGVVAMLAAKNRYPLFRASL
jgi:hypothetical protein